MTEACQHLHAVLSGMPRLNHADLGKIPANGIYVLFEKGENAHGGDRIVRIGTHRGQNNLQKRMREHLYTPNKDRSIFRKHVGRCQLAKAENPFLQLWNLDRTTRAARTQDDGDGYAVQLLRAEAAVTEYMKYSFSFVALRFDTKKERLCHEARLLSTIHTCIDCGPSDDWLGKSHPTQTIIKSSGLWNVQGLHEPPLSLEEVKAILGSGMATS